MNQQLLLPTKVVVHVIILGVRELKKLFGAETGLTDCPSAKMGGG